MGFVVAGLPSSSTRALTDGAVIESPVGVSTSAFNISEEEVWTDSKTKASIMKTIRALRLHILKQSAGNTTSFMGVGSKRVSMVFTLKKFPPKMYALQIPLPYALG